MLFDDESNRFDRTRLANFHRNLTALAMAGSFTCERKYLARGAVLVRAWFLDAATRMSPHFQGSQCVVDRNGELVSKSIIEGLGVIFACDAVRLLYLEDGLSREEFEGVQR